MNDVKEIGEAGFQSDVIDSALPVLVDFYATWCGPCRALAPALEGIAKAYDGRVRVVKVNIDDSEALAIKYQVRSVPTLMFFKGGQAVDTIVGLPSAGVLKQKLETVAA